MRQGLLTWVVWTIGVALGSDGEAADKTVLPIQNGSQYSARSPCTPTGGHASDA